MCRLTPLFFYTQTCNGCIDLNVQRLCYSAQQCTLARCIGTLTNQNRPMCGIGQTGKAVYMVNVVMAETVWQIFIETITTIVGLSLTLDPLKRGIQVKWIDDSFFAAMCTAKDASASFISIITSVINFIARSVTKSPVTYVETGAQRLDSNFQAMFTLIVTSLNNMLNQIALGLLYPLMAMQKVLVCELNTVTSVVSQSGFHITIGIPEIQVSLQNMTTMLEPAPMPEEAAVEEGSSASVTIGSSYSGDPLLCVNWMPKKGTTSVPALLM